MTIYKITIEKPRTTWFDRVFNEHYSWRVIVETDKPVDNYELARRGYARSMQRAKKKALKHILSVQKDLDDGNYFGLVFETKGSIGDVTKELSHD